MEFVIEAMITTKSESTTIATKSSIMVKLRLRRILDKESITGKMETPRANLKSCRDETRGFVYDNHTAGLTLGNIVA